MDYLKTVSAAINHIENNLFDKELASEIYKTVHVSKFHFHRMFLLVTKLTLGQYIKKRRFTEISRWLTTTDETILQIAVHAGYNSHEALTRAFKEYFGQTPSAYRKSPKIQKFLLVSPYTVDEITFSYKGILEPEIVTRQSLTLCGIKGRASLDAHAIDQLWNAFRTAVNRTSTGAGYAIWLDSDLTVKDLNESETYACFVGIEDEIKLASQGNALDMFTLSEGLYAKFTIKEDFTKVYLVYAYIYFEWLRKSGYVFGNDLILEYYNESFNFANQTGEMEILIPIIKKQ